MDPGIGCVCFSDWTAHRAVSCHDNQLTWGGAERAARSSQQPAEEWCDAVQCSAVQVWGLIYLGDLGAARVILWGCFLPAHRIARDFRIYARIRIRMRIRIRVTEDVCCNNLLTGESTWFQSFTRTLTSQDSRDQETDTGTARREQRRGKEILNYMNFAPRILGKQP